MTPADRHTHATTGGVRYKTGVVDEARPGFGRVRFDDIDGLVSAWLPVVHPKTQDDQAIWTLDVGEHVACMMDSNMEDGCIVGAIYSQADAPPSVGQGVWKKQFKDGGSVSYDRASGVLSVQAVGDVTIAVGGNATVTVAGTVLLQAAKATIDAVCEFLKEVTFKALTQFPGGMGGGGGAGSTIPGTVRADVIKTNKGTDLDAHVHTEQGDGAATSPPV